MPNYIINKITVSENFKEIASKVKSKDNLFDFNKIVPMPEILKGTQMPPNIVKDEDLKKELEKFNAEEKFAGRPISESESKKMIEDYGVNNWYDWSIKNWGTKWNACNNSMVTGDDYFEFQTAWGTPVPIFEALSKVFPHVIFTIQYADEDIGSNCGIYKILNGDIISEEVCDEVFALEMWGEDADADEEVEE